MQMVSYFAKSANRRQHTADREEHQHLMTRMKNTSSLARARDWSVVTCLVRNYQPRDESKKRMQADVDVGSWDLNIIDTHTYIHRQSRTLIRQFFACFV